MSTLSKRIAALERATPDGPRPALVVLYAYGMSPDDITRLDGVDLPRLTGESVVDYLARMDSHVRAERGRALPLVTFAQYGPDDAPDAPPAHTQLPICVDRLP